MSQAGLIEAASIPSLTLRCGGGETKRAAPTRWGVATTLAWSLVALLPYVPVVFALSALGWDADRLGENVFDAISNSLTKIASLGVLVLAAYFSRTPMASYLGLVRGQPGRWADIVIVGLAALAIIPLLRFVLGPALGWVTYYRPPSDPLALAYILKRVEAILVTPVWEEVLFRGFLYRALAKSRLGVTGAIAITALLFAGAHVDHFESFTWWVNLIHLVSVGLLLGWLRARTGSVLAGIGLHALLNVEAAVFAPLVWWLGLSA